MTVDLPPRGEDAGQGSGGAKERQPFRMVRFYANPNGHG